MTDFNPYAAPKAPVSDVLAPVAGARDIAALPVSNAWKVKFWVIEKAGGPKLPKLKELSFGDRMKINFNALAFLFGFLYYLVKGMWKKGLTLFLIMMVAVLLLSFLLEAAGLGQLGNALSFGAGALFGVRANADYYKKMVLNDNGWW
ncbi:MAG: DUF2628 domain-containing protein [Rubrivivax sp.]|nr:MAG: DUF2628 domain-containing protein [Rubrivivax sp.]